MFDHFWVLVVFRGGSESELLGNRLQSRLVVVVEVFSPYVSLLKGDEKKPVQLVGIYRIPGN